MTPRRVHLCFFFFNDTATTEIYTLSLHDALPICVAMVDAAKQAGRIVQIGSQRVSSQICAKARELISQGTVGDLMLVEGDRKSTRLNSSHSQISYALFCLKKKKIFQKWHLLLVLP